MTPYASATSVPVERTKAELETLLSKHGATSYGVMTGDGKAACAFVIDGRRYRLDIPLPGRGFTSEKAHEQVLRTRWRCVLLLVKGKLEAVKMGVSTVEREFMADMIVDSGQTLHEVLKSGGASRFLLNAGRA